MEPVYPVHTRDIKHVTYDSQSEGRVNALRQRVYELAIGIIDDYRALPILFPRPVLRANEGYVYPIIVNGDA